MKLASFTLLSLALQLRPALSALSSSGGDEELKQQSPSWLTNPRRRRGADDALFAISHPMPPNPEPYTVTYDDGTISPLIRIVMQGDETDFSHQIYEETLDGFTVKPVNGKYVYVDLDDSTGEYIETALVVGVDDPYSAHIGKDAASRQRKKSSSTFALDEEIPVDDEEGVGNVFHRRAEEQQQQPHRRTQITSGTLKNLVIAFEFSDHTGRSVPSRSRLDVLMNNQGASDDCPTGSVRDLYLENSFNQLDVDSTVIDWVTIDHTESYCAAGRSALTSAFHECLKNALDKTVQAGVDFRDYDLNNDGLIDGITFLHSGYGAEWGGTDAYGASTSNRIWSHKWALTGSSWSSNGVRVSTYHISPGVWGRSGSEIGRIGVIAHETGHFLGLPDLYDYGDGDGIGSWGLMANSWGFDGSQYYPPLMSAWAKETLGWVTPTVVSTSGTYSLGRSCDNADMIRIDLGFPNGEYLLIENRQQCSFDGRIPQGGLAIFHIDDNANNIRGYPGQSGWPENDNHYEVALLQADGNYNLERGNNRGDSGDLFHGGGVNSIGPGGTSAGKAHPNTKPYLSADHSTDLTISNISAAGTTMTFDINFAGVGTSAPVPITDAPTKAPVPITDAPTMSPVNFFCGDGVCEVSEGEGCGVCPSDCSFPTDCNVISNSGNAVYSSSTFGLVFDATIGATNLYFYELKVWLMGANADVRVYMKNGPYASDTNLDNWSIVFDGSITASGSRANVPFQSTFFAEAGSTVAFYISYAAGGSFVYSKNSSSFSNSHLTVQSGNALRQRTGNTLPSVSFNGRDFLEHIKYDIGSGGSSPTVSPVKSPTVSPVKSPTVSPVKSPTFSPITSAPTASPSSTCSCCEGTKDDMDEMEAMLETLMNMLTSSNTLSPVASPTLAPVACADRTGKWQLNGVGANINWCKWAENRGTSTATAKQCGKRDLYADCPKTCDRCP